MAPIPSTATRSTWMLDTHLLGANERAHLAWANVAVPLIAGFVALALGHEIAG